tara:strand:+ start:25621 stop:26931 length:1311 start_codon:yes stop_codon:yes gene_type:complete
MANSFGVSFLKSGASLLLLQTAGMGLSLGLSIVLARQLGPSQFGIYSYALALVTLISVPVQLGLPPLVVRETARLLYENNTRRMFALWRWSGLVAFLASAVILATVLLLGSLIFAANITKSLLVATVLLVPLLALGMLRAAALRGLGHVVKGQMPETIIRPALILLLLLAMLGLGREIDALSAMVLNVVGTSLTFVSGALMLARAAPSSRSGMAEPIPHFDWLRAAMFLGITSAAMVINRNLDIAMLGILRSATEVGQYKVSVTLAMVSATALNVLNLVLQPQVARLNAAGDINAIKRLVTKVARLSFVVGLSVATVFLLLGEELIARTFGTEYSAAYPAMSILIAGQLFNTCFGPVMLVLNMMGHEHTAMRGVIIAAGGNIVLNALLIPHFGTLGAAMATAATFLLWNVLLNIQARRLLGIDCSIAGWHEGNQEV